MSAIVARQYAHQLFDFRIPLGSSRGVYSFGGRLLQLDGEIQGFLQPRRIHPPSEFPNPAYEPSDFGDIDLDVSQVGHVLVRQPPLVLDQIDM